MNQAAEVRVSQPVRWMDRAGIACGLLVTILTWLALASRIEVEFRHASEAATQATCNLARTLESEVAGRLRTLDAVLRHGRALHAADPAGFSVSAWIGIDADADIVQAGLVGPDGILRQSLEAPLAEPVFLGDRDYVAALLAEPAPDRLAISTPLIGRTTGRETINLARPLYDAAGEVAGILYVAVDATSFSRLYRRLDLRDGVIALIGLDGVVRARVPGPEGLIGVKVPEAAIAPLRAGMPEVSRRGPSPLDGVERFATFRLVEGYPLVVSVALAADAVLAVPREERLELLGLGLMLTLLTGAVCLAVACMRRRERQSRAQLEAALAHIGQGVMMIDPDGRVAVVNRRATELLGLPDELAMPGRPAADIIAWQEKAGESGGPALLAPVGGAGGPGIPPRVTERTRPDGTILEIRTACVGDGSHVRTFADVTAARRSAAAIAAARDQALAAEAALAAALASIPHGVMLVGADDRVQVINQAAIDSLGLPPDIARPGAHLDDILRHQAERGEIRPDPAVVARNAAAIRAGAPEVLTYERVKPDGRVVEVRTTLLEDGRIIRTFTDVTERHAALHVQEAARDEALAARAAMAAAFENVPHGVMLIGADRHLQMMNRIAAELMDLPPALTRPGIDVRDIARFQLALGDMDDVPEIRQAAVRSLDSTALGPAAYERRTRSGRVMEVRTTHLEDGRVIRTYTDVTERHAALRAQEAARDEALAARAAMAAAFENAPHGIILVGADQRLQFVNSTAVGLLDLPPELAMPGTDMQTILRMQTARGDFDAAPHLAERALALLEQPDRQHPPYERRNRDGRVMEVRARALPDGRSVRTYTDVTERHAALRAQEAARLAAEAALRSRTEFLAVVSHELRTPLNAVIGLSDLLLAQSPRPDQADDLRMIAEAGRQLLALVDDILEVTRLERGRVTLREERFDPRATLEAMAALVAPRAAAKGLDFTVRLTESLPRLALGDQERLRQALLKLLDNAVKFTEAGSVTLSASLLAKDGAGWRLGIAVTDTGIGIPPEAEARLFEPFAQADSSMTRRFGGLGLGLAICRLQLESMGGSVRTEKSMAGNGSTFRVEVPLRWPPLRVLVAEDAATDRALALDLLRQLGHAAEAVTDGAAAVAAMQERAYDLVLMQVTMPGADGIEAARRIRALPEATGRVPVIAVTAHGSPEIEQACREAGMDRFETKPLQAERLRSAITAALGGRPA